MSSTGDGKLAGKSGRRNRKGETRRQKSDAPKSPAPVEMQPPEREQAQVPQADLPPAAGEPLEAAVAEAMVERADTVAAEAASPADAPSLADAPEPPQPAPTEPAPAEPSPVSLQTIANAYRDYTRKSFEEFGSFCEQLTGVRSLDKAMEVQTEFVKRAYENSVAESRKIRELHSKLAKQTFEPFQGLVGKTPERHGKS
jgi:hypothetical protein